MDRSDPEAALRTPDGVWRATWESDARALINDLALLHVHRVLWQDMMSALNEHAGHCDRTWEMHYTRLYIDSQAMAIRRLVRSKSNDSHASLCDLLLRAERRPDVMRRTPTSIQNDRRRLNQTVDAVVGWADQAVAHIRLSPTFSQPDTRALDEAIEVLAKIFREYFRIVARIDMKLDHPLPSPRWRSAFYEPLFPAP